MLMLKLRGLLEIMEGNGMIKSRLQLQCPLKALLEDLAAGKDLPLGCDLGHDPLPDVRVAAEGGLELAALPAHVLVGLLHVVGAVLDLRNSEHQLFY